MNPRPVLPLKLPAGRPPRILIVRLSAIGDVVMASGLIRSLRARWPDATIHWLVEPPAAPLLAHNPRLDGVKTMPRAVLQQLWRERRLGALAGEVLALRRRLRAERYDLVLDAQGLLKSGFCAWLTGAPQRVGLRSHEGSQHLMHHRVSPPAGADRRIGSEYRALGVALGAAESDFRLDLAVGAAPRERARAALAEAGVAGRWVALCPFTTRPQKHWFEDRWAELAQAFAARGLQPVIVGGPGDVEAAARIAALAPAAANLAGRLKLDETVAALAEAALLVGVDTGLTHMGTALDVPTVALFGSTRPYLDAATPRTVVLYDALPCSPCRRRPSCAGRFDCMRALEVQRVFDTATRLADGTPTLPILPVS
ncbi:glycosyltransferase family 9 protein [Rubrivivax sp. JA1055]|uniref:glycosyltransferase family 9 protein n=1 Tax=Rubrivivax sp. JA1055 TaxID=2894194 RepID=UPI001E58FCBA|nr:glycosyltransferase family 9 protein [Rubrivivax sp. JA1055]MCC9595868.1 glycosyltransferase family 9 protein [Rubrivivax sp. JA1055]